MYKGFKCSLKRSILEPDDFHKNTLKVEYIDIPKEYYLDDINTFYQHYNDCASVCTSLHLKYIMNLNEMPSVLFQYYNARKIMVDKHEAEQIIDEGSSIKANMLAAIFYSYINQSYYKYEDENIDKKPPDEIYKMAHVNRELLNIKGYTLISQSAYHIKYTLCKMKCPILFGCTIYESFFNLDENNTVPTPNVDNDNEKFVGMHAMLIYGYEEDKFKILTSWENFGSNKDGKFFMKADFLLNKHLCFDFMSISSNHTSPRRLSTPPTTPKNNIS